MREAHEANTARPLLIIGAVVVLSIFGIFAWRSGHGDSKPPANEAGHVEAAKSDDNSKKQTEAVAVTTLSAEPSSRQPENVPRAGVSEPPSLTNSPQGLKAPPQSLANSGETTNGPTAPPPSLVTPRVIVRPAMQPISELPREIKRDQTIVLPPNAVAL